MHPLIAEHRTAIAEISQRYQIRRLDVFGSAARADDFDPATSDADFLVEFAPGAGTGLLEFFGSKDAACAAGMPMVTCRAPTMPPAADAGLAGAAGKGGARVSGRGTRRHPQARHLRPPTKTESSQGGSGAPARAQCGSGGARGRTQPLRLVVWGVRAAYVKAQT